MYNSSLFAEAKGIGDKTYSRDHARSIKNIIARGLIYIEILLSTPSDSRTRTPLQFTRRLLRISQMGTQCEDLQEIDKTRLTNSTSEVFHAVNIFHSLLSIKTFSYELVIIF